MPVARNEYKAPNPKDMVTFPKIRVQRSATGLFAGEEADVGVFDVDTTNEDTIVIDTAGTATSYYRHRGENFPHTIETAYTKGILFGDYVIRQMIKHDIPDADIVDADWDIWRDETFLDMQMLGLGRSLDPVTFTPATSEDYNKTLPGAMRRVSRVEIWWRTPSRYWTDIRAWEQRPRSRTLRIMHPRNGFDYLIYGLGELRDLSDLDDELWNILYWGMRWRYMLMRQHERVDMRPFMSRTRQSDTTSQQDFKHLADDAKLQFDQRVAQVLLNEGMPSGSGGS